MTVDRAKAVARVIIGKIAVDATIEEVHTYSATITDYLVETGSSLSDNRRKNPDKLRLTVFITDHPIDEPASHADGVVMAPRAVSYQQKKDLSVSLLGVTLRAPGPLNLLTDEQETKEVSATGLSAPLSRVESVYAELRRMHNDGEIFDVVTAYRTFESVGIESMTLPRTGEAAVEFTLELKTIRYATAKRMVVEFTEVEAAKPKVSKGKQTPVVVTDQKRKSALARIVDGGPGALNRAVSPK